MLLMITMTCTHLTVNKWAAYTEVSWNKIRKTALGKSVKLHLDQLVFLAEQLSDAVQSRTLQIHWVGGPVLAEQARAEKLYCNIMKFEQNKLPFMSFIV